MRAIDKFINTVAAKVRDDLNFPKEVVVWCELDGNGVREARDGRCGRREGSRGGKEVHQSKVSLYTMLKPLLILFLSHLCLHSYGIYKVETTRRF